MEINLDVSKSDMLTIRSIVDRAVRVAEKQLGRSIDRISAEMDICCVHANEVPLRLDELLAADNFNFIHDVFGIEKNLNRETGKLENFFTPRFARPSSARQ